MPEFKQRKLFDDLVMRLCFSKYPECVRLIARIVLNNPTLDFVEEVYQKHISNPNTDQKSVTLDYYFKDKDGKIYDIEIENSSTGSCTFYRRARFYSSLMDAEILTKGYKYKILPDSYVIFFCQKDPIGKGLPLYTLQTYITEDKEEPVADGRTIIYVNGEIENDTALGRLVKDFKCTKPEELWYDEIKTFFKEEHKVLYAPQIEPGDNPEIQAMYDAVVDEDRVRTAKAMMAEGLNEDLISKCTTLPIEEVRKLKV